jgi:predicted nucleotidyltransferase
MASDREQTVIQSQIESYADDNEIRAIAARDYGSRARGLESPDSDYDVLFLFVEPPSAYAVGADTDTYSTTISEHTSGLDTEIELHGWNLKKFIGNDGLAGSNPTALEFVASSEVYLEPSDSISEQFESICTHARSQFTPYALINHYRSLAAGNYGKYIEQSWTTTDTGQSIREYTGHPGEGSQVDVDEDAGIVTVGILGYDEHTVELPLDEAVANDLIRQTTTDPSAKRYLNVSQALCRARYVEETGQMFDTLDIDSLLTADAVQSTVPDLVLAEIGDLIEEKQSGGDGHIRRFSDIDEWIETELDRDLSPEGHVGQSPDTTTLRRHSRSLYNEIEW